MELLFIVAIAVAILVLVIVTLGHEADENAKRLRGKEKEAEQAIRDRLKTQHAFAAHQFHIDRRGGNAAIALDESDMRVAVAAYENGQPSVAVYQPEDVLQSEIRINGTTVTKVAKGQQLGRAILGGAAIGSVGAMVGALSADSRQETLVDQVVLRVTVADAKQPVRDIPFFYSPGRPQEPDFVDAYFEAMEITPPHQWHGLLSGVIQHLASKDPSDSN